MLLKRGDIEKVVTLMNKYTYSKKKTIHLNLIIREYIDTVLSEWDEEKKSYKYARAIFANFIKLNDREISKLAQKKLDYVELENSCDIAVQNAQKDYDDKNYIDAMVTLNDIDKSYSQYIFAEDLYDECKNLLLEEVDRPITISDYEMSIKLLDVYIGKVDDKDFVNLKKHLECKLIRYKDIYNILINATDLFERESYKESFKILFDGEEKYPDNKKIKYALSAYQYSYMLDISSQVVYLAEEDEYDRVVEVLEKAIDVYDCEIFRELLHEANMKNSFLYTAKNKLSDAGNYVFRSAKKIVLGDFAEDEQETLLSLGGSVAASVVDLDAPLDVRDLAYDITHWGEGDFFAARFALDAIGILPVIGALKYIKHLDTVADTAKNGEKIADGTDAIRDAVKVANIAEKVIDSGKTINNISDITNVTEDVKKKAEAVSDLTDDYFNYAKKADKVDGTEKAFVKFLDDKCIKFREGNKLLPENSFSVNGYDYVTDNSGRIISAEGKLKMYDPDYHRNMEKVRDFEGQDYRKNDESGHLIGHQFGGSDKLENLVPMDRDLNRRDYKKLEIELAKAVQEGSDVRLKVEPVYKGTANRATEFKVSYSIDGNKNIIVFEN